MGRDASSVSAETGRRLAKGPSIDEIQRNAIEDWRRKYYGKKADVSRSDAASGIPARMLRKRARPATIETRASILIRSTKLPLLRRRTGSIKCRGKCSSTSRYPGFQPTRDSGRHASTGTNMASARRSSTSGCLTCAAAATIPPPLIVSMSAVIDASCAIRSSKTFLAHLFQDAGEIHDPGHQQHELLAAVAGDHIVGTSRDLRHGLRDFAQGVVAGAVTVAIVVLLEVIDIDHRHAEHGAGARRAAAGPIEGLVEVTPVGDAGERILLREAFQLAALQSPALDDCGFARARWPAGWASARSPPAPSRSPRSSSRSSVRPVMKMTPMSAVRRSARSTRRTSYPSIPGMETSSRIKLISGSSATRCSAVGPSFASTRRHSSCNRSASAVRLMRSSSTISTVGRRSSVMMAARRRGRPSHCLSAAAAPRLAASSSNSS